MPTKNMLFKFISRRFWLVITCIVVMFVFRWFDKLDSVTTGGSVVGILVAYFGSLRLGKHIPPESNESEP